MAEREDLSRTVTFTKRVLSKAQEINWAQSEQVLIKAETFTKGTIEDSNSDLLADFANRYIGGGVLRGGHVQEEIIFMTKPECVASMLFCTRMEDNEVIFISGAERFSNYMGYGLSLKYAGDYIDESPRDPQGKIQRQILAYDATMAFATGGWHKESLDRDLHKAYCGFLIDNSNPKLDEYSVATGNWGCGAFGGDPQLKFLQQLMAASVAGRKIVYFTFNNAEFTDMINEVNDLLVKSKVTVGQLYNIMVNYQWKEATEKIFAILKSQLTK